MKCQHETFQPGDVIILRGIGSCDVCGSPQDVDGRAGSYICDDDRGHVFQIVPFPCPGCHNWCGYYHLACGTGYEITEWVKKEQNA